MREAAKRVTIDKAATPKLRQCRHLELHGMKTCMVIYQHPALKRVGFFEPSEVKVQGFRLRVKL